MTFPPKGGVSLSEYSTGLSPELEQAIDEWVTTELENSPQWGIERWEEIGEILGVKLYPR